MLRPPAMTRKPLLRALSLTTRPGRTARSQSALVSAALLDGNARWALSMLEMPDTPKLLATGTSLGFDQSRKPPGERTDPNNRAHSSQRRAIRDRIPLRFPGSPPAELGA